MDKRAIGIFDSGVGGMTVYSELVKELPQENMIYLGDTKNFPYGTKSKENIIKISNKCAKFLLKQDIKLLVVACGTATSQAIDSLKENLAIPVVGIIEPTVESIKSEIEVGANKKITVGVMATVGTIRSNQWEVQIKKAIPTIEIKNQACPLLAPMAEEGWTNNAVAKEAIKEYVKIFQKEKLDKLILGCTHYPLFEEIIRENLGAEVDVINTGTKIATYLKKYLKQHGLENNIKNIPHHEIFLTDIEENFIKVAQNIAKNLRIEQTIKEVEIE